jgi:polysaccharide pyruvyl transferase CsaB
MKNILICGNYGATNLGDEAILDGIINLVKNADPEAKITVMSSNPKETSALHNVESVHLLPCGIRSFFKLIFGNKTGKTFSAISKTDAVILGGGGLFTDEKMMAIVIWSLHNAFFMLYKKPVFCLGQSVGPLRTFFGKMMTRNVYKFSRLATVRDQSSQKLLRSLGLPLVTVLTDPAFSIHLGQPSLVKRENIVVFSIRPWIKGDSESLHKICAQFIDWIYEEYGLRSILLPFQELKDNDSTVLNKIFIQIKNKNAAEVLEYTSDYRKIIEIISRAKAVIGMRLHSLVFSALSQTPFIALSYSSKVTSFVNELDLGEYCLDYENLDPDELKERFKGLMRNYDEIQMNLNEKQLSMRILSREHEKFLKTFLGMTD